MSLDRQDDQTSSRLQRKRAKKYREILRTAAEVLTERGYSGTSLDEIAERLDVAKATIYHYVVSKDELISACVKQPSLEAMARLEAVAASHENPAKRLEALIRENLDSDCHRLPRNKRRGDASIRIARTAALRISGAARKARPAVSGDHPGRHREWRIRSRRSGGGTALPVRGHEPRRRLGTRHAGANAADNRGDRGQPHAHVSARQALALATCPVWLR